MSLDDALAGWADTVRLPGFAVDDVYRRIVATPAAVPLAGSWWREYTAEFTGQLVRSTRPLRPVA